MRWIALVVSGISAGGALALAAGTMPVTVPFAQSAALHRLLDSLGSPNELLAIRGAGHGDFDPAQVIAGVRGGVPLRGEAPRAVGRRAKVSQRACN